VPDDAVELADQRFVGWDAGLQASERAGEARVVAAEAPGHSAHRDASEAASRLTRERMQVLAAGVAEGAWQQIKTDPG